MTHLLAPVLGTVVVIDWVVFAGAAAMVLAGALGVVLSRHPVHAALSLVLTLFGIAVLFVEQDAQFLAAVQVIVYAGAIVVLFLFVIMLLGVDRQEDLRERIRGQRPIAIVVGIAAIGELLALTRVTHWATGAHSGAGTLNSAGSNVATLAKSVFTTYLLPFELTTLLLIIAVVGAVVLARRPVPHDEPPAVPSASDVEGEAPGGPGEGGEQPDGTAEPGTRPASNVPDVGDTPVRRVPHEEEVGSR